MRNGPAPVRMDPHSPVLSESLLIAELTGEGPEEILLIGITGEQYEVGAELSDAARNAAGQAVEQILLELDRLRNFLLSVDSGSIFGLVETDGRGLSPSIG